MTREDLLDEVFRQIACGAADRALEICRPGRPGYDEPVAAALGAVASFWLGEFEQAVAQASSALDQAADDHQRALALAALGLARGGLLDPDRGATDDPITAAEQLLEQYDDRGRWWTLIRYLVAEAALVSARLADATRVIGPDPRALARAPGWAGHPFGVLLGICTIRVLSFRGQINIAAQLLSEVVDLPHPANLEPVLAAVGCLVRGNADDPDPMRERDRIVAAIPDVPVDFGHRGTFLLLAYGAVAVGDEVGAADLVLRAGGSDDLAHCTLVDRALGFELLLLAALSAGDLDAAAVWVTRLGELAADPIPAPVVDRALSRYAHVTGSVDEAIILVQRSLEACQEQGRALEAAEANLLLARYRIEVADLAVASRQLRELVAASDQLGHAAVRRSATAALGAARRRLPPVTGGGWAVLSPRETEVARMILSGSSTDRIAAELFLTPATIRLHTSRVLCAFAVPNRIGLLAAVSGQSPRVAGADLGTTLTQRQIEVLALLAQAHSNQQIANELGVSVKAVEKHVAGLRERLQAPSRFELARIWWQVADPIEPQSAAVVQRAPKR